MVERFGGQEPGRALTRFERNEIMFAEAGIPYRGPGQNPVGSIVVEGEVPVSEFDPDHINFVEGKKADLGKITGGEWWVSPVEKEEGGYYDGIVDVYTYSAKIDPPAKDKAIEDMPELVKVHYTDTGRPIGIVK